MKVSTSIELGLIVIVAIAGLGIGYVSGGSGAAAQTQFSTSTQYSTATQTITQSTALTTTQFSTETATEYSTQTVTTTPDLSTYFAQAYTASYPEYNIPRATLVSLLNSGNTSLYLIDVRQATGNDAYSLGHIAGAINIPFQNMTAALQSNSIPKNKMIVTICYTGMQSVETMAILRVMGYNAYALSLGMSGWSNLTRSSSSAEIAVGENYPIVTGTAPGTWTVFNP